MDGAGERNLFGMPGEGESAAALAVPTEWHGDLCPEQRALLGIAQRIGRSDPERRVDAISRIPAGATYFAQFIAHDLDFLTREGTRNASLLDLGLIYGDGPRNDSQYYQVPRKPGQRRHLLRMNRARPTESSPPWGAARDLPRLACPHLDAHPAESRTEVLVPNAFSDSNLLLGQVQTLWALLHNAIAERLAAVYEKDPAFRRDGADRFKNAFEDAREINRGIYRGAIVADVLGTWLCDPVLEIYRERAFRPFHDGRYAGAPREFLAGVGRLGHGLVREIYQLNARRQTEGLRNLVRHTATGRPHAMPLTEDWLVDFARFFAIGGSRPQMARALGPHVARPFHTHGPLGAEGRVEGLVLRDLLACTSGDVRSVRSLAALANAHLDGLPGTHMAGDPARWTGALRAWLAEAGIEAGPAERLAEDPPLTLFLMLEAEADTGGESLGVLGSFIMAETIGAALPPPPDGRLDAARHEVFGDAVPADMAGIVAFLQSHHNFADGAQLHSAAAASHSPTRNGDLHMLDHRSVDTSQLELIEVADHIEMGRLVVDWATGRTPRPADIDEFKRQVHGIAVVPDRIKTLEFVQGTEEHLVVRLPVRSMMEAAVREMSDPDHDWRYPMPPFYGDFYRPGLGPMHSPLELLMARVGDYTIAQCK
jgi:hypothetical protein